MKLHPLFACLAWAGVLVSSATPAQAIAITTQSGEFVNCQVQNTFNYVDHCLFRDPNVPYWTTAYVQNMKFVTLGCSVGGCNNDTGTAHTDVIYAVGRKTAALQEVLCLQKKLYALGSCAC
jgi:hypothetical protein